MTTVTAQDILLMNVPDDQDLVTTFGEYRKLIKERNDLESQVRTLQKQLEKTNHRLDVAEAVATIAQDRRKEVSLVYKSNLPKDNT